MISQFIEGSAGPCFLSLYLPDSNPRSWVLCFPPFAEEMNKSRTMMSAQARALTDVGVAVVVPDLYGTGDSGGDFADADWGIWRSDMTLLAKWIREQGGEQIYFWGIRLGCLLALDVARGLDEPVAGMLFWQPVSSGQQAMTQFLRLRMAASMMGGEQEKVGDLRKRLEQGENLEVAGYELSSSLVHAIDGLTMIDMVPEKGTSVTWFDVSGNPDKPLPMISRKIVEAWQQAGIEVVVETVVGEPFWTTQEIAMAPELNQRMTELLADSALVKKDNSGVKSADFPPEFLSNEQPVQFECQRDSLSAVLHRGAKLSNRGVLLVVGGPQYRIGSHRQFILLARYLAAEGVPVLRFDYRGMGDSSGPLTGFEGIGEDIRCAIDSFQAALPQIEEVVIWGLCDAATAAAFYAPGDARIKGLALLNPWVRSEQGEAKAYIKHYYIRRLLSRNFWSKVVGGKFDPIGSLKSLAQIVSKATATNTNEDEVSRPEPGGCQTDSSLVQRMEVALSRFDGEVMLVLSGNDLTAAEFREAANASPGLQKILKQERYKIEQMEEADHTFSRRVWRDAVASATLKWMKSW